MVVEQMVLALGEVVDLEEEDMDMEEPRLVEQELRVREIVEERVPRGDRELWEGVEEEEKLVLGVQVILLWEQREEVEHYGLRDLLLTMLEEEQEDQEILVLRAREVLEAVEVDNQHQLVLLLVLPTQEEEEEVLYIMLVVMLVLLEDLELLRLDILRFN